MKTKNTTRKAKDLIKIILAKRLRKENAELDMPAKHLRYYRRCTAIDNIGGYLSVFFSFFLRLATTYVDNGKVLIGLILFCMFYFSKTIIASINGLLESINENKNNRFEEELSDRCVYTLEMTRGLVKGRDKEHNCLYTLNNSEILSTVKNVLGEDWNLEIVFPFKVLSVFIAIISAIVAIATENTLTPEVMSALIGCTLVFGFIIKYAHVKRMRGTHEIRYDSVRKRSSHRQDLVNSTSVCDIDFKYRIGELRNIINEERKVGLKTIKSNTISNVLTSVLQCSFQLAYILLFVRRVGIENITTGSIAVMTGGITIIGTINGQLDSIVSTILRKISRVDAVEAYMENFENISDVLRNRASMEKKHTNKIVFPKIEIGYAEDSENDIPFKLITASEEPIVIEAGDVVLLNGASGSGKSTLMKVLTGQLVQENVEGLVKADYYMYYCKDHSLGMTNTLYDELFCKREADHEKMKDILLNLHLWQEFSNNCKDVWQWLKEKKFSQLSDGQKQRIICAKILYWLDENVDLVAFDEATSGLDADDTNGEGDAQTILEYIIRYCNKDKKRMVLIATHQDTEKLQNNIKSEYKIKNFVFKKNGARNEIVLES